EHDRDRAGLSLQHDGGRGRMCNDYVSGERDQLFRDRMHRAAGRKPSIDADILAFRPSVLFKRLAKCGEPSSYFTVVLGEAYYQHPDPPHPLRLLRSRRGRPGGCRAAEQRDELAPFHSITSSAMARSPDDT